MSVNYRQTCIVGYRLSCDEVRKVLREPEYVYQPRFDTKTGRETHQEKVTVRHGETVYSWGGVENEDFFELGEDVAKKFGLDSTVDQDYDNIFIGVGMLSSKNWGSDNLLDGSLSFEEFHAAKRKLEELFPDVDKKVEIHFISSVG